MDSMEKGPSPAKPEVESDSDDNNDDDDDQDLYQEINHNGHTRSLNKLYRNGFPVGGVGGGVGGGGGFRIRIPTGMGTAQPGSGSKVFGKVGGNQKFNPNLNQNPNPNFGKKRERERDPVGEVVSAIKVLGDGFVRMEQMKMEMAREIETMRMEMEMKRTEMILESQQRIVEAFAKAVSEKKKKTKTVSSSPQQP